MKRCNIIFIIESGFPCYTGGIENWLYNVIVRLPKEYKVTVISGTPSTYKTPFYEIPDNIRLLHFQSLDSFRVLRVLNSKTRLSKISILLHAQAIKRILEREVVPEETTIVALGTITVSMAALAYKKRHRAVRYICSSRGPHAEVESHRHPKIKSFLYRTERLTIYSADLFLVNGYDTRDYYKQLNGISGEVLLNGVDVHGFDEDNNSSPYSFGKPVIVSVGTVIDIKGVNELIKAFAILRKENKIDAALCFVGKGATLKYEALAKSLDISEDVHFLGNQKNVKPYLKNASIVACLSGGGGFSMAALEAMASRTPIVGWDSPVYQQFNKEEKTMELVETGNIKLLAEKLRYMFIHIENMKAMGEKARVISSRFDWSAVIQNLKYYLEDDKY